MLPYADDDLLPGRPSRVSNPGLAATGTDNDQDLSF